MSTNNFNLWMVGSGHEALAKLFKERSDYHLGISGQGALPPWTTVPPVPDFDSVTMAEEYARRKVTNVSYAEPDVTGEIGWEGSLWSLTSSITKYVYLNFSFEPSEGVGLEISQLGIFVGTVPQGAVPPGQYYLEPADILEAGTLMYLQNIVPRTFTAFEKPIYEMILTF